MRKVFDKDVPSSLSELLEPRRTALLIIDMQNYGCAPKGINHESGADLSMYEQIVPRIARFAEVCRGLGILVINVKMSTLPNGLSNSPAWMRMRMRSNHIYDTSDARVWNSQVEGTWSAEFVEALAPKPGDLVVQKFRSSAMHGTNLDLILRSNDIRTALVAGSTTEGCVESTVRDLGFYDYFAVVLSDCVGSDVRVLHEASMLVMSAYRAEVTTAAEVEGIWNRMATPSAVGAAPVSSASSA